jgi:uncharacterized protein YaaR (DUF327 family)
MSKTNFMQIEKARTLIKGLNAHASEVAPKGLGKDYVESVAQYCKELEECDAKLEDLRKEVHEQVRVTNDKLAKLKEAVQNGRLVIRNNYLQEQWASFGVMDKK